MANIYDKIKNVRKPRVQISYDVEEGESKVKKELPFVVGVIGDLSGASTKPLTNFKKRKFVNIHGENFNEVMEGISPGIDTRVKNKIKNDGSVLPIQMEFKSMEDFSPASVAQNVEPLKRLLKIRSNLKELLSKAERSEELEKTLEKILQSEEHLHTLSDIFKSQENVEDVGSESNTDESELESDIDDSSKEE